MSSQWKELIFYIDGLFQKHSSQSLVSNSSQHTGDILSKSQQFHYMNTLVDVISHPSLRNSSDFSRLLETTFKRLFMLCSDECDDIRIYSEDCLNRLTHNLEINDLPRVLRQIHLELRRNGPPRSLRSAIRRHAQVCQSVNPLFLRLFIQDLVPLLLQLSNRDEELLMEEFIDSFGKIIPHIAKFFSSQNILHLIGNWVNFLTNRSLIKRRVGANVLVSLVTNCKKSVYYISILLKNILGLIPEGRGKFHSVLGVLLCLRHLAPYLSYTIDETQFQSFRSTFGENEMNNTLCSFHFNHVLQAFVFAVHSSTYPNNNIVNAALDTLAAMLTNPPSMLINWLVQSNRLTIFQPIIQSIKLDSHSDLCIILDKSSVVSQILEDTKDHLESELQTIDHPHSSHFNPEIVQQSTESSEDYESVSNTESSDSSSDDENLRALINQDITVFNGPIKENQLDGKSYEPTFESDGIFDLDNYDFNLPCTLDDDTSLLESSFILEIDLFPLTRIIRRLCTMHLLTGISGSILSHGISHISIQNSAINCFSAAMRLKPELLLIRLFPLDSNGCYDSDFQCLSDVLLFISHPDPFTVEKILILSSLFIKHYILNSYSCSLSFESNFAFRSMLTFLLDSFVQLLMSTDGIYVKASCLALKNCIPELLQSCFGALVLNTLSEYLYVRHHPFWLARVELCNLLSVINWQSVAILERNCIDSYFQPGHLQKYVTANLLPSLLIDEDPRVWESFPNVFVSLIQSFYIPNNISILFDPFEYFLRLYFSEKLLNTSTNLQTTLQILIAIISNSLIKSATINNLMSALYVLAFVARQYPPSKFPLSWGISLNKQADASNSDLTLSSYGILPFLFSQLFKPEIMTDCTAQSHILFLLVSLLRGGMTILQEFHRCFDTDYAFSHLIDKHLSSHCSQLFKHIIRILRMFDIIVCRQKIDYSRKRFKPTGFLNEQQFKGRNLGFSKESLTKSKAFTSLRTDPNKLLLDKKGHTYIGLFSHVKDYTRLFQILKKSHFGYQHSISLNKNDRFCSFLNVILETLKELISCSSAFDIFSHTEEILSYLFSALKILPSSTLLVIEQFITILYGWNTFLSDFPSTASFTTKIPITLHDILYFIPLNIFHKELFYFNKVSKTHEFPDTFPQSGNIYHPVITSLPKSAAVISSKKADRNFSQKLNFFLRKADPISSKERLKAFPVQQQSTKHAFKQQIKLFEGILTFSLNIYSSSSLLIQQNIITLLVKLVIFQLNYSLIDCNSVLLNKIFTQVEYIEQGLISGVPRCISALFQFLVVISINKPDILPFSKIVILCESAISSEITTSSISALKPLVIFLYPEAFPSAVNLEDYLIDFHKFCKNIKNSENGHKDVIFTILIRLIQYPDCIEILANILKSVQNCHIKWTDTSLLIIGPLLQKIKRNQIQINDLSEFNILQGLIFNLHPSSTTRVSLFFFSLHSTTELHSIQTLLSWIALAFLVTKLSFKCYDEHCLFTEIKDIFLIFPRAKIDLICLFDPIQIGPNLSPEELIVHIIAHLSSRSISLLSSLLFLSRTRLDLEPSKILLWNIISQLFTLILWVLKDNTFKRTSDSIVLYLHQLIGLYLESRSCDENTLLQLQKIKNHFPILFLKLIHLCGSEANASSEFWNEVVTSNKNYFGTCQNHFHQYIFDSILFEIIELTFSMPENDNLSLLEGEYVFQVLLSHTHDLSANKFVNILKISKELSVFMGDQLRCYLLSRHSPFRLKELFCLLKILHFSIADTFLVFSHKFFYSKNQALSVTFQNDVSRIYQSKHSLVKHQDFQISKEFSNYLDSKEIEALNLSKLYHILNPSSSNSEPSAFPDVLDTSGVIHEKSFIGHPSPDWYFSKFAETNTQYNFFTMDRMKPLRYLDLHNLTTMLSKPKLDLQFLYHVIDSSKACIIDNISQLHNNEVWDEDCSDVIISITSILRRCSFSLFNLVNECFANFNKSDIDFIFNTTKCLVALFDVGICLSEFVDDCSIKPHRLLIFGFMHLDNISTLPFLLTNCDSLIPALLCPSFILEMKQVRQITQEVPELILSGCSIVFKLIVNLLGINVINNIKGQLAMIFNSDEDIGKLSILLTLLPTHLTEEFIPSDLISPLRKLIISLCNLDNFYSKLIIPEVLWDGISSAKGIKCATFPQFPVEILRDPEIFFEMMKRLATLGWRTKDQFEEIWSLIIRVLVPSFQWDEEFCHEEIMEIMKTSCIAVEAVTTHLLTYLLHPLPGIRNPCFGLDINNHGDSSTDFIYSRDGVIINGHRTSLQSHLHTKPAEKIFYLKNILEGALRHSMQYRKVPFSPKDYKINNLIDRNVERALDYTGYLTVQFSFPPFVSRYESDSDILLRKENQNPKRDYAFKGWLEVNLSSCVRLLYDLYDTWLLDMTPKVPLMLYHSILKSLLFLSDLFTDESQFEWLLDICLRINHVHPVEDEMLKIYINLSIFKAGSIIHKDGVHILGILDILENGLLSSSPTINISTIEGLLFLLQEQDCTYLSAAIPKISTFILKKLEIARDIILNFHQQYLLVLISAGTELILHHSYLFKDQFFILEFTNHMICYCSLPEDHRNWNVVYSILYSFELLIIALSLQPTELSAIVNTALKFLTDDNSSSILFCALSLLVTCMYLGDIAEFSGANHNLENLTQLEIDPMTHNIDLIAQTRDRIALLLNILRLSGFLEARFAAQILHHILLDLLPSNQSMNTIIGEFLDENHPNVALIGWLMYKLFQMLYQRGQDKEVNVWALLCLSSFIKRCPVEYAIWNLSCLFVSVSKDPNIYNLLPFVLSRLGKIDSWDEEIFLIAGTSFYHFLEHDEKSQFAGCFNHYINVHSIFLRLLYIVKL